MQRVTQMLQAGGAGKVKGKKKLKKPKVQPSEEGGATTGTEIDASSVETEVKKPKKAKKKPKRQASTKSAAPPKSQVISRKNSGISEIPELNEEEYEQKSPAGGNKPGISTMNIQEVHVEDVDSPQATPVISSVDKGPTPEQEGEAQEPAGSGEEDEDSGGSEGSASELTSSEEDSEEEEEEGDQGNAMAMMMGMMGNMQQP